MRLILATSSDLPLIVRFQLQMALETEQLQLDANTVHQGVMNILDHPDLGYYQMIQIDSEEGWKTVGCFLIQWEWSDWRARRCAWLHSVYVLPEYRKQGLFSRALTQLQEELGSNPQVFGIRLFVEQSNQSAISVYERGGFTRDHYFLYEWQK